MSDPERAWAERVGIVSRRLKRLETLRTTAQADRDALILEAIRSGVPVARICRLAGVGRTWFYARFSEQVDAVRRMERQEVARSKRRRRSTSSAVNWDRRQREAASSSSG